VGCEGSDRQNRGVECYPFRSEHVVEKEAVKKVLGPEGKEKR
jgi:hypothetical protein